MSCESMRIVAVSDEEELRMTKKVLMLCGDYTEDYETMVPFQALSMLGVPGGRRSARQESRRGAHRRP